MTAPAVPAAPERPQPVGGLIRLPLALIVAHPRNVRVGVGERAALEELAASIRQVGLLQPVLVTQLGDKYALLAGHRRVAAMRLLKMTHTPALLSAGVGMEGATARMLVENMHRVGLSPVEEARAFQRLIDGGYNQGEVGRMVGRSQGFVNMRLGLLRLSEEQQAAVERGDVSLNQAADAIRASRVKDGSARGAGVSRPKPRRVAYFRTDHPLGAAAGRVCGHDTLVKLGPACGPCWEAVIRADERNRRS